MSITITSFSHVLPLLDEFTTRPNFQLLTDTLTFDDSFTHNILLPHLQDKLSLYDSFTSINYTQTISNILYLTDSFTILSRLTMTDVLFLDEAWNPPIYNDILSLTDSFSLAEKSSLLFNDELRIALFDQFIVAAYTLGKKIKDIISLKDNFIYIPTPMEPIPVHYVPGSHGQGQTGNDKSDVLGGCD